MSTTRIVLGLVLLASPVPAQRAAKPDAEMPAIFTRVGVVEFGVSPQTLLRQRPALRPAGDLAFRMPLDDWEVSFLFEGGYGGDAELVGGGLEEVVATRSGPATGGIPTIVPLLGSAGVKCFVESVMGADRVWAFRQSEFGTVRGIYIPSDSGRSARGVVVRPPQVILRWIPGHSLPKGARLIPCPA